MVKDIWPGADSSEPKKITAEGLLGRRAWNRIVDSETGEVLALPGQRLSQEAATRLAETKPEGLKLALLHPLGLSQYGPEQVNFLRYRPVLDNRRLKEVFGYVPSLTSAEVFELFRKSHGLGPA